MKIIHDPSPLLQSPLAFFPLPTFARNHASSLVLTQGTEQDASLIGK
jgi:hypothetical protein